MRALVPGMLLVLAACARAEDVATGVDGQSTAMPRDPVVIAPTADDASGGGTEVAAVPLGPVVAMPEGFRAAVERSERLGRAMFEKDMAAARATGLLLDSGFLAGDSRIHGWLTESDGESMQVTYVGEQNGRLYVAHEVGFAGGPSGIPVIGRVAPSTPLDGERARMYRARETAIAAFRPPCDRSYNTVVLPAGLDGEQGWLVYLLAATLRPDEKVLAGHGLVKVSADGTTVERITPLSLSCLVVPDAQPQGVRETGVMMTHLTTAWPLETHVYTSLLYDTPVFVQTRSGLWQIQDGRIRFVQPIGAR